MSYANIVTRKFECDLRKTVNHRDTEALKLPSYFRRGLRGGKSKESILTNHPDPSLTKEGS